ncbi:MAG TPA: YicC family protein [Clostridiaceae bacterium]|nr:YicC family protein [Clostridiaceae bacterium]
MAKSMTGFGKALITEDDLTFSVEIKSVNQKNRDLRIHMPYTLNSFDAQIRKLLDTYISRGYVDVNINYEDLSSEPNLKLDLNNAIAYLNIYSEIEELTGEKLTSKAVLLARNNNLITKAEQELDEDRYLPILLKTCEQALQEFDAARQAEGTHLISDLKQRIETMQSIVEKIASRAETVPEYHKMRLLERLANLVDENLEEYYDGQRVAAEIAVFADRADVTEEIIRLKSHLKQFLGILELDEPIGKNLDFLVQELLRETNTIGSKANDLEITQMIVEMKSTIEKIREQVQNIE